MQFMQLNLSEIDHDWYQQIFLLSPDPAWIIENNKFIACNEAAVTMLGYASHADLLQIHPSQISPEFQPDGENSLVKAERMLALAKKYRVYRFEWMHCRADASTFLSEVTLSTINIGDRELVHCVWHDITGKNLAETKLQQALAEIDIIFQHARIGIVYLIDRRFFRVNQTFTSMFGYSEQELLGQTTRIIYRSEDAYQKAGQEIYSAFARSAANYRFDIDAVCKNGEEIVCELIGSMVDQKHPESGFIWLFTDVTELRRSQMELIRAREDADLAAAKIAANEALYRLLTEDALDVVWKVDKDGIVEYVSPADERLRGFCSQEVLGQPMQQFFTTDGLQSMKQAFHDIPNVIASGADVQPIVFEAEHRCKNGAPIWGEVLVNLEVDHTGTVIGYHGITREISARKRAEEQLAHALAELEVIFQIPGTGVIYTVDRRIVRANKSFAVITDRSPEELIGQSTRFIYPTETAYIEAGQKIARAFAAGDSCRFDLSLPHSQGRERTFELFGTPVDVNRPERGSIWLLSDVTQLRQAEREIREAKDSADWMAMRFKASSDQISRLLDNSGQGFLAIDHQLRVDPIYSRACEELLGCVPAGQQIDLLLFPDDQSAQILMRDCVRDVLKESDAYMSAMYLSLLPAEFRLQERTLHVQYIRIETGIMLILSDMTEAKNLVDQVERESRRLEMIVAAVTDGPDFFAAVDEFKEFIGSGLPAWENRPCVDLYRAVHTFKGTLNQFGFNRLPQQLHITESMLQPLVETNHDGVVTASLIESVFAAPWQELLEEDLLALSQVLGHEFVKHQGIVSLLPDKARQFEQLAQRLLQSPEHYVEADRLLLQQLTSLRSVSLRQELGQYNRLLQRLAERLEKEIAPLHLDGDDFFVNPDGYGPFLRSLVHVFRNAVDHGIEYPDERLASGKSRCGQIRCRIVRTLQQLHLTISDDGAGIDVETLRSKAQQRISEAAHWPVADLVFFDGLSAREEVSELSGRGIGMAAVRAEVLRLHGTIEVETQLLKGTSFLFRFPLP